LTINYLQKSKALKTSRFQGFFYRKKAFILRGPFFCHKSVINIYQLKNTYHCLIENNKIPFSAGCREIKSIKMSKDKGVKNVKKAPADRSNGIGKPVSAYKTEGKNGNTVVPKADVKPSKTGKP
jgi:hypothetical protein